MDMSSITVLLIMDVSVSSKMFLVVQLGGGGGGFEMGHKEHRLYLELLN